MEHGVAESEEMERVTVAPHRLLATRKSTAFLSQQSFLC